MNITGSVIQSNPISGNISSSQSINGNAEKASNIYENNYNNLSNQPSINSVTLIGNKTSADLGISFSASWNDISDKPNWISSSKPSYTAEEVGALPDTTVLFSGNYNNLSNQPSINNVPLIGNKTSADLGISFSASWNDISDKPNWISSSKPSYTAEEVGALPDTTVLFSGNYNDLTNKPSIPTNTDYRVQNTLSTTTKAYVTGTTSPSTNTGTQIFDTNVYIDNTSGKFHADDIDTENVNIGSSAWTPLTLHRNDSSYGSGIKVTNIDGNLGKFGFNKNGTFLVETGDSTDGTGNMIKISADSKVTASEFIGSLTGNADTATKATQDSYGNTITSTYIKSIAKQDDYGTFRATRGDDTTFDFKANAVINQNHATGTASRPLMLANRQITDSTVSYESHLSYCNNAVYVKPSTGTLTATKFSGTMADYAEMFEWADGNTSNADRRGLFVTISSGEKISLADDTNDILGIVSASPLLLGDNPENEWNGKYKKDIFGSYLLDTNGDKILSDEYNELQEYISRENRSEWTAVGLMGKLIMVDDGSCQVGWYCKPCSDCSGRATYSIEVTRCKVMKRIDDTHIKVFFH